MTDFSRGDAEARRIICHCQPTQFSSFNPFIRLKVISEISVFFPFRYTGPLAEFFGLCKVLELFLSLGQPSYLLSVKDGFQV